MRPTGHLARLDAAVARLVGPTRSSRTLGAMTAGASIGGDALLVAMLVVRSRSRTEVGLLGGALLLEQAVAGALKHGLQRDRPPESARPPVSLHPDGPAFPSGHTSSGFYAATVLAERASAPLLFTGAVLVALARLHQGVHRASDVLVGALLGTTCGAAARSAARSAARRGRCRQPAGGRRARAAAPADQSAEVSR